jgi:hypothetical protein
MIKLRPRDLIVALGDLPRLGPLLLVHLPENEQSMQ